MVEADILVVAFGLQSGVSYSKTPLLGLKD